MENNLTYNKIETLPNHLKIEVNDFVDFLLEKEKRKQNEKEPTDIMKFAGIWSNDEAIEITKIINEGCGNIDLDGWK